MNGVVIAKNNLYEERQEKNNVIEVDNVKKIEIDKSLELRIFEEVKAAIFLAKQFPRNEKKAEEKILELCESERFKENALYSFMRGNEIVEGPTIRFAEALARAWGNIQYSVIELETEKGISKMLAYAWDVENNTKSTKQFDVSMERYTRKGTRELINYQECYEMKAAYGARFLRGCILNLIPNDLIEIAIEKVKNNITKDFKQNLELSRQKVLGFMTSKLNVTQSDLENYLNIPFENWQEKDLTSLKLAFNGIKEGQLTIQDFTGRISKVTDITEEQIKELMKLDEGKNKLFFFMQTIYKKNLIGKLTSKEYVELKKLLQN